MTKKYAFLLMAIAITLVSSTSCATGRWGESLQQSLAADPRLAEGANTDSDQVNLNVAPSDCNEDVLSQLPELFPKALCYPNGELITVSPASSMSSASENREDVTEESRESGNDSSSGDSDTSETVASTVDNNANEQPSSSVGVIETQWQTEDSIEQVQQFYRNTFQSGGWEIAIESDDEKETGRTFEAVKQGDHVTVSMNDTTKTVNKAEQENLEGSDDSANTDDEESPQLSSPTIQSTFEITFRSKQENISQSSESSVLTDIERRLFSQIDPNGSETNEILNGSLSDRPSDEEADENPTQQITTSSLVPFTDINEAPEELQSYIEDLAKLGILTGIHQGEPDGAPENHEASSGGAFKPNEPITRREYAQWLMTANNIFYGDRPSRKIRPAISSSVSSFQDVSSQDRGYDAIQGLAEAGLIPSSLSGESNAILFRPDAPLTREALISWKVPLDRRGNLPNATVESVEEAWGFQDASTIAPSALQAILADYQNGDNSNILRAFGYTTLFQPQKAVTRAEAAAVLWHFGYQGDGLSANMLSPQETSE